MKRVLLIAVILTVALSGIYASPGSPIKKLEKLVENVEENHASFTDKDWKKIAETYDEIKAELKKEEFSNEELKEIGKLKGRLKGYLTQKKLKALGKDIEEIASEVGGGIEGFFETLKKE